MFRNVCTLFSQFHGNSIQVGRSFSGGLGRGGRGQQTRGVVRTTQATGRQLSKNWFGRGTQTTRFQIISGLGLRAFLSFEDVPDSPPSMRFGHTFILRGCAHGRAAQAEARGEQFLSILRPLISKRLRLLNPLKVSKHFQAPKLPSNL